MKLKPHGRFLVSYVTQFVNGDIERKDFDQNYDRYFTEHIMHFGKEHPRLSRRFVSTVGTAYDLGHDLTDEALRRLLSQALQMFSGKFGVDDLIQ